MSAQNGTAAAHGGLRPFHVLALAASLFSWPVWAEDAPLGPPCLPPNDCPAHQTFLPPLTPSEAGLRMAIPRASESETASTPTAPVAPSESKRDELSTGAVVQPCETPVTEPCSPCTTIDERDPNGLALRLGWWAVIHTGNPWVVGQWQSTDPSPFFDVDGLYTNGTRTFNYSVTGTDNESTKANFQYFGPDSQGFININRFPHANEHQNFDNMAASARIPGAGPGSGQPVIPQDLNIGENYAIRVDQYEAQYKFNIVGRPGKDDTWLKAGINVWDQREFGNRQSNNTVHCFTAQSGQQKSCHVLSEKQNIDWNTFEITPTFEARLGSLNLQYSHTFRVFSTSDQLLIGQYTDGGANIINGFFPFAVVPESMYNMDKLKMNFELNEHNRLYGFGYVGQVENHDRDVTRDMGGFDLRWTNTAFKGLTLVTYVKNYNQSGERPTTFLPDETQGLSPPAVQASIRTPIGFNRYTAGERFSWRPWQDDKDTLLSRLNFTGGYEFDYLIRSNENWSQPLFPPSVIATTPILFQPNTTTNTLYLGVQTPWSNELYSYLRYKLQFIDDALVGFRQTNGAVNSSLPDTRNVIEFGGEWFPSLYYGASFNQTIELSSRRHGPLPVGGPNPVIVGTVPGDILNFGEDTYCTSLITWCRPWDKVTLTANANYFTNWVKQQITIGDDYFLPGDPLPLFSPLTGTWTYGGTAVEFGFGFNYQYSSRLRIIANYEVTFGKDVITSSDGFPGLGSFSAVRNVFHQVTGGLDWKPRDRMVTYFRYQLVSYDDRVSSTNSGLLNMFLAGMSYSW